MLKIESARRLLGEGGRCQRCNERYHPHNCVITAGQFSTTRMWKFNVFKSHSAPSFLPLFVNVAVNFGRSHWYTSLSFGAVYAFCIQSNREMDSSDGGATRQLQRPGPVESHFHFYLSITCAPAAPSYSEPISCSTCQHQVQNQQR